MYVLRHVKLSTDKAVLISVRLALLACRHTVQQTNATTGDKSTCPLRVLNASVSTAPESHQKGDYTEKHADKNAFNIYK